jgi:hypothetical protein
MLGKISKGEWYQWRSSDFVECQHLAGHLSSIVEGDSHAIIDLFW